ncbi:MAG: WYL domain-containing protein [Dermatophilaceae bacterium]
MASPSTPAAKTERLMNLVMTLLWTRRALPKARIREIVEQYRLAPSVEAFERMFERDKEDLRELGIPLVTEDLSAAWDDEPGYRIHQRDYALPDLAFTPDELAVLGLAARTWSHATLAGPAAQALRKLRASGVEPDPDALAGIEPRLATSEPAFGPLVDALLDTAPVTFAYRRPGTGEPAARHVQPWGLTNRSGRWYLTGLDTDRGAPRVFRLSRVTGPVTRTGHPGSYTAPPDHDPRRMLARDLPVEPAGTAEVAVADGRAHELRRLALAADAGSPGWTILTIPYADSARLAADLASHGASVRALAPPALVEATRAVLAAAAAGHAPDPDEQGSPE